MNTSHQRVITAGRACALLGYRPAWTEALFLRLVGALYRRRLRQLIGALPAEVSAEILAASEKINGPVQEFGRIRGGGRPRAGDAGPGERWMAERGGGRNIANGLLC